VGKFRRSSNGKTIDTIHVDGHEAVLRMNTRTHEFTLHVEGHEFKGYNPSELIQQATVVVSGHAKLDWQPFILVKTEAYNFEMEYERGYRAKDGKKEIWRRWHVKGGNEWTSRHRNSEGTLEMLEGKPGDVRPGPNLEWRQVPYTPERWKAIRTLDQSVQALIEQAKERLEKILETIDLEKDLVQMANRTPRLLFSGEEKKS